MRKALAFVSAVLALTLSACSSSSPKDSSDVTQPQSSTAPQVVIVPNVVGMNKDDAVKKLEDLGLKVEVAEKPFYKLEEKDNVILS